MHLIRIKTNWLFTFIIERRNILIAQMKKLPTNAIFLVLGGHPHFEAKCIVWTISCHVEFLICMRLVHFTIAASSTVLSWMQIPRGVNYSAVCPYPAYARIVGDVVQTVQNTANPTTWQKHGVSNWTRTSHMSLLETWLPPRRRVRQVGKQTSTKYYMDLRVIFIEGQLWCLAVL